MSEPPTQLGIEDLLPPEYRDILAITDRTYRATSADGVVTAEVGGDQRVRGVEILRPGVSPAQAGQAATAAVNEALTIARRATVEAMRDLPGLDPELRASLDPHAGEAGR